VLAKRVLRLQKLASYSINIKTFWAPLRLVRVILLVLIGFLQLLLAPKFLICVIGPVVTNSSDLVLLAYGWYAVGMWLACYIFC
jgi:hypothetical protein